MSNFLFSLVLLYLFIGIFLFLFQRRMIFNKSIKPKSPKEYGLSEIIEVFIKTPDNLSLLAWFHKPNNNQPILIYFPGNSYDIGERAYRIQRYVNCGWGILLLSWRGYSGNNGRPSEKNLYIDGQSAVNWIKKFTNYNNNQIILYGESLGCAVAIQLGIYNKFKSIILEAPFTSIGDIGQKKFPLYPVKILTFDKFDNLSKINKVQSPILIIHGKKDEVVPYRHSIKLYEKAKKPKKHLSIDEAMHNNLYDYSIDKDVINFNN